MLLQRGLFRTSQSVILGAGFEIIPIIPLTPSLFPQGGRDGVRRAFLPNLTKGGLTMATAIRWETSLTTAKAKAKKEKKLILMDFYNNL
jgi:hypothetical protein